MKTIRLFALAFALIGTRAAIAQELHQVANPDITATVYLPPGWEVVGGQDGMIDVRGPNGAGSFGLWSTVTTPEAVEQTARLAGVPYEDPWAFPYCTPEQVFTDYVPHVCAIFGQSMTEVEVLAVHDVSWGDKKAAMMGIACNRAGVRCRFLTYAATWWVTPDCWGVYWSFLGVREEEFEAAWPWIAQSFPTYRFTIRREIDIAKKVYEATTKVTEIIGEVALNRADATDWWAWKWARFIRR